MKRNTARKTRTGVVISNKMDKTVVVKVENFKKHPIYHKRFKVSKKFKAHDENNTCMIGDKVKIVETRPLSKNKYFRILEVLVKGKRV